MAPSALNPRGCLISSRSLRAQKNFQPALHVARRAKLGNPRSIFGKSIFSHEAASE